MSTYDPKRKSKNVLACDSAAGFPVLQDISLFPQGVWKSEKEVYISGIQKGAGPIKVTMEGKTIFGYSKEANINVLSLADIQENCSDWHGTDMKTVYMLDTGIKYTNSQKEMIEF